MARLDHTARVELATALVKALAPSVAPDGPAATEVADRVLEAVVPVLDGLPDRPAIVLRIDSLVRRAADRGRAPGDAAFQSAAAAGSLPVRYRIPFLLSGILGLDAPRVAKLIGADADETEAAILGARRLHEQELEAAGVAGAVDLSRISSAVIVDADRFGRERTSGGLPFGKLAVALVVVVCGIGAMVFLAGDGTDPLPEKPPRTEVATDTPLPRAEETVPVETGPAGATAPRVTNGKPPTGRPSAIRPGVAMLLPTFLRFPNQVRLERVWAALAEKPRQAREILSRLPEVKKEAQRVALLLALAGANGDPEVRERLLGLLRESGSPAERRAAAAALAHRPGEDHLAVPAARSMSVRAGVIEDTALRGQLLSAVSTERDPEVLGTLIRLLGPSRARDRSIDERLYELARSPSDGLRRAAIDGLRAGREGDQQVLGRLIEDAEIPATDRARLVSAWARHDDEQESLLRIEGLIDRSEEIEIREAAVRSLGALNSEGARRKAAGVLANVGYERRLRMAALGVVAAGGSEEGRSALRRTAETDGDEIVRNAAAELLRALSPEKPPRDDAKREEDGK